MGKYKTTGIVTLFDSENTAKKLSDLGNPLEKLCSAIDFEAFRKDLEKAFLNTGRKSNAGAKPYDYVMMFKIMVLQRYYNISDEQTEYQINDRSSFKNFLGLASGDRVPDAKTIWLFREQMTVKGISDSLFHKFVDMLAQKGLIFNEGQIIDASFVLAPKQHNKPEENEKIKQGEGKSLWDDNPNKKRQKDVDARWTVKGGVSHYGYKLHGKVDRKSKLLKDCVPTAASVHDSQAVGDLLDESDRGQALYADSAYVGQGETLQKYDMQDKVCEKGYRDHPLTDDQKVDNKEKSKIRSRVEHVFGFMEGEMHGLTLRSVGFKRTANNIFMTALTYNMFRYEQIVQLGIN